MPARTAGESWLQAATNLARSGGSALQSALQVPESAVSVEKNVGASNPVLPTSSRSGPVSRTGTIPEEPVVTQAVAAGSGVLCGFLPEPSGTCCAAFCAALRTGSAACHHVLNVMLPGLGVMGRSHLRRLSQLIGNHVGRIFLHPIGRTRRPKILQEPQP